MMAFRDILCLCTEKSVHSPPPIKTPCHSNDLENMAVCRRQHNAVSQFTEVCSAKRLTILTEGFCSFT